MSVDSQGSLPGTRTDFYPGIVDAMHVSSHKLNFNTMSEHHYQSLIAAYSIVT